MKGKNYSCKKCTDEREVDYHRVGRIRSEFAARNSSVKQIDSSGSA